VSRWYVFALTGQAASPFVAAGHRVEFVKSGGIYAAIERIAEPPTVSEDALRSQHEAIDAIAGTVDALLPARFGAFVEPHELDALVLQRRDAIAEALSLVKGRRQMSVRLLGPGGHEQASSATRRPYAATGTTYLEGRREAVLRMPELLAAAAAAVRSMVAAERLEAGRGRIGATLYHLIATNSVASYRQALAPIQAAGDTRALTVSGPWAPFAFAPDLWA
jgi:gas vesicle protein GvpL/GvpF